MANVEHVAPPAREPIGDTLLQTTADICHYATFIRKETYTLVALLVGRVSETPNGVSDKPEMGLLPRAEQQANGALVELAHIHQVLASLRKAITSTAVEQGESQCPSPASS